MSYNNGPGALKAVLYPEGPGFLFVAELAKTGSSKVVLVKSLADGIVYVRKESMPKSFTTEHTIQSKEVRVVKQIQHLGSIPRLIGWTEYQDEGISKVVNVSYWELCNGGTLAGLMRRMRDSRRPVPEKCLWSILGQMLRITLNTIRLGILNKDCHEHNWLLHLENDSRMPRVILGDWGLVEFEPTANASPGETKKWWEMVHTQLKDHVVRIVRELMIGSNKLQGSAKDHFNRVVQECKSDQWKRDPMQLINRLNIIQDYPPSWFESGEQWVASMERMYSGIVTTQQELEASIMHPVRTPSMHTNLRYTYDSTLPYFNHALTILNSMDNNSLGHNRDMDELIHLWKVAHIDSRTNTIISIEPRPAAYPDNNYRDSTNKSQMPRSWIQAHEGMQEMVKQWAAEDQTVARDFEFGLQDESTMKQDYNTAI